MHQVRNWTVHSVMDVGCGRGISTAWFATHGLRTECVEGSHDAIEQSMVPDASILTEHDFSRGPWWPGQTFDLAWAVEFLEHVNLQFHYNYVQVFRKAAVLAVSHSNWGGWHHVEVHDDDWWIDKFEAYGFRHSKKLTAELRTVATREKHGGARLPANGQAFNAQHVWNNMLIFINPVSGCPRLQAPATALPGRPRKRVSGTVTCCRAARWPRPQQERDDARGASVAAAARPEARGGAARHGREGEAPRGAPARQPAGMPRPARVEQHADLCQPGGCPCPHCAGDW